MNILKKLKKYLRSCSEDRPDEEEFHKITITRDNEEPITFKGRLINEARIEKEQFDMTLNLYLTEDMKVILESRYIDSTSSVHKALEFDNLHSAGLYIQQITEELQNDKVQKDLLIQ